MARLSAEEMFKNMIGRKDEEPQPAQETAAAPTAEKKKASTVQVTVRLRPEQHKQLKAAAFHRDCDMSELVRQALAAGVTVTAVPGACACIAALISSGLPTRRFTFEAFLPQDKKEKAEVLAELKDETRTMVIYEAPHRLQKTLAELFDTLGDRRITLCRELTKRHETIEQFLLSEAIAYYAEHEPRGEYVMVIEGMDVAAAKAEKQQKFLSMTIEEHVAMYEKQGMTKKDAIKQAAADRGVPKREVYNVVMR